MSKPMKNIDSGTFVVINITGYNFHIPQFIENVSLSAEYDGLDFKGDTKKYFQIDFENLIRQFYNPEVKQIPSHLFHELGYTLLSYETHIREREDPVERLYDTIIKAIFQPIIRYDIGSLIVKAILTGMKQYLKDQGIDYTQQSNRNFFYFFLLYISTGLDELRSKRLPTFRFNTYTIRKYISIILPGNVVLDYILQLKENYYMHCKINNAESNKDFLVILDDMAILKSQIIDKKENVLVLGTVDGSKIEGSLNLEGVFIIESGKLRYIYPEITPLIIAIKDLQIEKIIPRNKKDALSIDTAVEFLQPKLITRWQWSYLRREYYNNRDFIDSDIVDKIKRVLKNYVK